MGRVAEAECPSETIELAREGIGIAQRAQAALSACRTHRRMQTLANFEMMLTLRLTHVQIELLFLAGSPAQEGESDRKLAGDAREAAALLLGLARYLEGKS